MSPTQTIPYTMPEARNLSWGIAQPHTHPGAYGVSYMMNEVTHRNIERCQGGHARSSPLQKEKGATSAA